MRDYSSPSYTRFGSEGSPVNGRAKVGRLRTKDAIEKRVDLHGKSGLFAPRLGAVLGTNSKDVGTKALTGHSLRRARKGGGGGLPVARGRGSRALGPGYAWE